MRFFLKKIVLFLLPVLIIILAVNYLGDAARLFDREFEKLMVDILLNKKYVTNISNYDDRVFQKEIIGRMHKKPDIVIIGSSRTMLLSSKNFPQKSIFNNSVSGASIEDLIAIYQLYKDAGVLPLNIIIGIDPWTFNINNKKTRWRSLEDYYCKFTNKNKEFFSKPILFSYKYKQLFSLSYFQSSINNLPKLIKGQSKPVLTDKQFNVTNTKFPDGSITYGNKYRNASIEEVKNRIISYGKGGFYGIENFYEISNKLWMDFVNLVADMKENNINVKIFLCPYAPYVFDVVSERYTNIIKTEEIILTFANEKSVDIVGSFNPYKFNFDEKFFYDGMHCKEEAIELILNSNSNFLNKQ